MAGETSFLLKKIEKMQHFFALFSQTTSLPYVEVDPETYDDCVLLFYNEADVQKYAKSYTEKKILLAAGKIPGASAQSFLISLFFIGVNAIRIIDGDTVMKEELANVIPAPNLKVIQEQKIPGANPEMQLTGIYFAQELRRPIQRTDEEKKLIRDLEEEMAVNLMRSRWIVCADISEITDDMTVEEKNKKIKLPYVKTKSGDIYHPVFSDMTECQKFNAANKGAKLRLTAIPYADLPKFKIRDAKGFCFNPKGFNLFLTTEMMEQMKRYAE